MKRSVASGSQLTLEPLREPLPPAPHPAISIDRKAQKRDATIAAMNTLRAELIEKATEVAIEICSATGSVTSVQVIAKMREDVSLRKQLHAIDLRFMGAVLLPSRGWVKLDYVGQGSKGRPIPRWTRAT